MFTKMNQVNKHFPASEKVKRDISQTFSLQRAKMN